MITGDTIADFLWCWNHIFFLETSEGCFLWSNPEYPNGDNTIAPYAGTLVDYLSNTGISCIRDSGRHRIKDYCGVSVTFVNCEDGA